MAEGRAGALEDYATVAFSMSGVKQDISLEDWKSGWASIVGGLKGKPTSQQFNMVTYILSALLNQAISDLSTVKGQVKEGSQMALFPFTSLSMRFPFSCSRTSPYATLHNLPAIWCKSGVVVGVVDFRPKCPVYRSDLQRNGLWLPWWLPRKSPS